MRLDNIIRKILPQKLRVVIGLPIMHFATKRLWTLKLFMKLLHGYDASAININRKGAIEYMYKGYRLKVPPDGTGSIFEVFYEQVYDSLFKPYTNSVIFDVGAYVGMWSVKASMDTYYKSKIFAFEPIRKNQIWLNYNKRELPIEIIPIAVTDYDGEIEIYISKASACHSTILKVGEPVKVPCRTLDSIAREYNIDKVDFIKIDAEGAELEVLKGAENILEKGTTLSIASYHELRDGTHELPLLMKYLYSKDYNIYRQNGLRGYLYAQKIS